MLLFFLYKGSAGDTLNLNLLEGWVPASPEGPFVLTSKKHLLRVLSLVLGFIAGQVEYKLDLVLVFG